LFKSITIGLIKTGFRNLSGLERYRKHYYGLLKVTDTLIKPTVESDRSHGRNSIQSSLLLFWKF